MGKLAAIALVLWLMFGQGKTDDKKDDKKEPSGVDKVNQGLRDLTGSVDRATHDARQLLTAGAGLGDAFSRMGAAFSGGLPASEPDPSPGRTPTTVTDHDQTYSAEDPTSWDTAPVSMF